MYVCHCRAVTDGRVRCAIEEGAREPAEVGRRCGAGTRCGGCLPALQALLAEYGFASDTPMCAPRAPMLPAGVAS
ncbi:MAG TPA: (2Fe-2S)-binding protein [Acidimicrobiales bacterium]|nr:(2Fe-2S)-binding protein [Acidimicrobiales bacterium]